MRLTALSLQHHGIQINNASKATGWECCLVFSVGAAPHVVLCRNTAENSRNRPGEGDDGDPVAPATRPLIAHQ
jgi:hypothetical protein